MKLFDLHCDTPLEIYLQKENICKNSLHVSLDKAAAFENYFQCAAVWSDAALSDRDCLHQFRRASDYFKSQLANAGVALITKSEQLCNKKRGFILTVEGARLVSGDVDGVKELYDRGVRLMTLVWNGEDAIGGAWDSDMKLTPLGHAVTEKCIDVGIIPDISHGSVALANEVISIMKKHGRSPIATHSNAFSVRAHRRNLSDELIREICSLGGVCGINLCVPHLAENGASVDDVLKHIEKFIDLGGKKNVAFGCDFDGILHTPLGIDNISSMDLLYYRTAKKFGEDTADDIFYNNAYNYLKINLPK